MPIRETFVLVIFTVLMAYSFWEELLFFMLNLAPTSPSKPKPLPLALALALKSLLISRSVLPVYWSYSNLASTPSVTNTSTLDSLNSSTRRMGFSVTACDIGL